MQIVLSDRAIESPSDAPANVRRAFEKQLRFLTTNLMHSSLRDKKYDESPGFWPARVNPDWRFYSTFPSRTYRLEDITRTPN